MTLEEMLALLPDEPEGNISAADMRAIATELYESAHSLVTRLSFQYSPGDSTPPNGKLYVDSWSTGASELVLSETTNDGEPVPFGMVTTAVYPVPFIIGLGGVTVMRGTMTGTAVGSGVGYRTIPIVVTETQAEPPNNAAITLLIVGTWTLG